MRTYKRDLNKKRKLAKVQIKINQDRLAYEAGIYEGYGMAIKERLELSVN